MRSENMAEPEIMKKGSHDVSMDAPLSGILRAKVESQAGLREGEGFGTLSLTK